MGGCSRTSTWAQQDSNLRPTDYESAALTAELWARWRRRSGRRSLYRNRAVRALRRGRSDAGHRSSPGGRAANRSRPVTEPRASASGFPAPRVCARRRVPSSAARKALPCGRGSDPASAPWSSAAGKRSLTVAARSRRGRIPARHAETYCDAAQLLHGGSRATTDFRDHQHRSAPAGSGDLTIETCRRICASRRSPPRRNAAWPHFSQLNRLPRSTPAARRGCWPARRLCCSWCLGWLCFTAAWSARRTS